MARSVSLAIALVVGCATFATAQVRVNPTGVSVSTSTATTVFLTYGGVVNIRASEAWWCGELIPATPSRGSKCDPSTLFGRLPARYDLSTIGTGSLTDVMSIPPSVTRLAYQAAERGATSTFFYVRRFVSLTGGPDEYVAVTCRLTGGGARVPFSLTDVALDFASGDVVPFIAPGEMPPQISARIAYTGTGRLVGRWEIVLPGEELPTSRDLLTEASLPPKERGSQRRFTQLERFNIFLPPDGRVTLPGPDLRRIPTATEGTYRVLLRVEATDDREGDSNLGDAGAGSGIVHSGGVAGFPLPVLRYVVAGEGARTQTGDVGGIRLLGPRDSDTLTSAAPFTLMWIPGQTTPSTFFRLELETEDGVPLLSALLPHTARRYEVPAWVAAQSIGRKVRWRLTALGSGASSAQSSLWRSVRIVATLPTTDRTSDPSVSRR